MLAPQIWYTCDLVMFRVIPGINMDLICYFILLYLFIYFFFWGGGLRSANYWCTFAPQVSIYRCIYFIHCLTKAILAFGCQNKISHFSYMAVRHKPNLVSSD